MTNQRSSSVGALPAGLIDVHTHALDPEIPDLNGHFPGDWPRVTRLDNSRARVTIGDRPYRDVDDRCWSIPRRLADMDADGVAVQVLSPMPATLLHGNDAAGARILAAAQNDFLAELCKQAPGRIQAFGAVPLQDVAAAVDELTRCVAELGLLGVTIGTRVGERSLADAEFDPFFDMAADLGAVVFIHPVDYETDPRLHSLGLGFGAGMPTETGISGASLLAGDVMRRRSAGKICLAHAGGTLPWLLPRLDVGERLKDRAATDLSSERVRTLFVDSLTYDATQLRIVVDRVGGDRVLLGTDYPFPARERPPGRVLYGLPDSAERIGRDNALALFLPPPAHVDTFAGLPRSAHVEQRLPATNTAPSQPRGRLTTR
ncbi:amidohydrolase family protein [Nocardia vaccinii]|uniref:amidohydrolase family protein n=1 Tax=Nocardia vaccinii TaxID=1822 RepID=UPI00083243ED|nr:amidohydrolase family protein [Nocardia vaccinii]